MSRKECFGIFGLVLILNFGIQAAPGQVTSPNADNADLLRDSAAEQAEAQRYSEAADTLRSYLEQRPEDFTARLEMARLLSWSGRYQESAQAYQQALQAQPANIEARLGLAQVLSWARRYDEALQNYQEILEREPKNREARVEIAKIYAWKGNLDRALELYADLQELYPNDRDVLLGKGRALQWAGRVEEANKILEPLRNQYPEDQEILLALAGTQLALGRQDLAFENLKQAETIGPDNQDLQRLRSLVLRQLRPVLVMGFNPSFDSDDLHIFPYTATLYFSPAPRVRSYVRAAITPSMTPGSGIAQGREAVLGTTVRAAPWLILRGEVGRNSVSSGKRTVIGSGGFAVLPAPRVRFDFNVAREFINYLPRSVALGISRVNWQAGWDFQPTNRWLLHLDYFHSRYSDTNRAHGANLTATRTFIQQERATLDGGYLYSISGFSKQLGNGYFDPSQLQRHASLLRLSGRATSWLGYSFTGTLGAEQQFHDPYRADGTLQVGTEILLSQRLRLNLGYGFFRTASLTRAGAYRTQSASSTLEIQF
ncbi:MAG: tetratricopeptide repeat protein [Acidobacteria bacterium]|nr:tetratricopeptide repeat protein [Acidobacteriota bacterium]